MIQTSFSQSVSDEYPVPVSSSPSVYGRPLCLPLDTTLLTMRFLQYLLTILDLLSDEGCINTLVQQLFLK